MTIFTKNVKWLFLGVFALFLLFNQFQIAVISSSLGGSSSGSMSYAVAAFSGGNTDLDEVDVTTIESTAQGIAALFPVHEIKTTEDAIAIMVPTGTPDYGEAMGITFDDPITALSLLENAYYSLDEQIRQDPELWDRYLSLAAQPRGISCEFCCGVGAQGVTAEGKSRCGCSHNPAALALTQWLILNTDYTDAEILYEVYRWKTLFFPQDMVGLAVEIAGGNSDVLADLPGMVGGC